MIYRRVKSQEDVNCIEITIEEGDKAQFRKGLDILKKMIDATKQATKEPKPLEDLTMEERLERFNRIYLPPLKEMENYNNQKARSLS